HHPLSQGGGGPSVVHVILSVAKDLMPVASGDEVIRCAQDDRTGTEDGMGIAFTLNGQPRTVEAPETATLLDVLRNHLGLMGTRYGCGLEQCGCCMVLVDGQPSYACTREVGTVADRKITTVEGLGTAAKPHPIQQAFLDEQAGQCGYCLSGIVMSAKALLDRNPHPSRADIVTALDKHLCRCGAHQRILRAVKRAAVAIRNGRPA